MTFAYVPVLLGVFRRPTTALAGRSERRHQEPSNMAGWRCSASSSVTAAFKFNPNFPVNTLMMMRGAVAAEQLGIFKPYVDQMYRFMWAEPRKMDDPAIVTATWKERGFDADKLSALIQDQAVKDKLVANTQNSVERGTFGSPTFFVGDEIFFGKDRLRDVEDMIVESKAA
ncbi:MAG: DsbA family protein [Xanthobacteraceae bacterium]